MIWLSSDILLSTAGNGTIPAGAGARRWRPFSMAFLYYIDGYNVIHFCSQLRPLAEENFEAARDALVERVARFCAASGEVAKIVFDGRGHQAEPAPPFRGSPGMEVIYSPKSQSADAFIEREAYVAPRRGDVVVVTGDRGIR